MSPKVKESQETERPVKDEQPKERYFKVRFQAKSHPNDLEDVSLSVNGETLLIRREDEVIVPARFLECADHAVYPHFRQLPNSPRKVVGKIKVFPYDRIAEATEKEYLNQKQQGTKKTKAAIRKHGFDLVPDDEEK